MTVKPLSPTHVIPAGLGAAVDDLRYWFVIGGQAVRCLTPYRPSRDVDFGVRTARDLDDLLERLSKTGKVELQERQERTVHLTWNGIKVSIFVLDSIAEFTEDRRLSVTGILATKLNAILARGTRRDFFDLYVTLHDQRLGIGEALAALRKVYSQPVSDALLFRALTYFADAEREAKLPGEGPRDWAAVKDFFSARVGQLLVPPAQKLKIEGRRVDVQMQRPKKPQS